MSTPAPVEPQRRQRQRDQAGDPLAGPHVAGLPDEAADLATVPISIPPEPVTGLCILPRSATIDSIAAAMAAGSPPVASRSWRKEAESRFSRSTSDQQLGVGDPGVVVQPLRGLGEDARAVEHAVQAVAGGGAQRHDGPQRVIDDRTVRRSEELDIWPEDAAIIVVHMHNARRDHRRGAGGHHRARPGDAAGGPRRPRPAGAPGAVDGGARRLRRLPGGGRSAADDRVQPGGSSRSCSGALAGRMVGVPGSRRWWSSAATTSRRCPTPCAARPTSRGCRCSSCRGEVPFVEISQSIYERLVSRSYARLRRSADIHRELVRLRAEGAPAGRHRPPGGGPARQPRAGRGRPWPPGWRVPARPVCRSAMNRPTAALAAPVVARGMLHGRVLAVARSGRSPTTTPRRSSRWRPWSRWRSPAASRSCAPSASGWPTSSATSSAGRAGAERMRRARRRGARRRARRPAGGRGVRSRAGATCRARRWCGRGAAGRWPVLHAGDAAGRGRRHRPEATDGVAGLPDALARAERAWRMGARARRHRRLHRYEEVRDVRRCWSATSRRASWPSCAPRTLGAAARRPPGDAGGVPALRRQRPRRRRPRAVRASQHRALPAAADGASSPGIDVCASPRSGCCASWCCWRSGRVGRRQPDGRPGRRGRRPGGRSASRGRRCRRCRIRSRAARRCTARSAPA